MAEEKNWWENYSPIPYEQVPATLRATLTPNEVIVAVSKNSWVVYFRLILGHLLSLIVIGLSVFGLHYWSPFDYTVFIIIGVVLLIGISFLIKFFMWRRRMVVITNQRFLGAFNVKVFSTDKLDIPLRSMDSFGVDDTLFGNIFGFTKIKLMSRSSSHFIPWITKESCQSIKNAYYDWDSKQSK